MTRWRITVEYDGTGYVGWQRQDNGPSIQQSLEEAVHKFCGETVRVFGAGRTDAGVHALGQVAHFDIDRETRPDTVRDALNAHLRDEAIAVLAMPKALSTAFLRMLADYDGAWLQPGDVTPAPATHFDVSARAAPSVR